MNGFPSNALLVLDEDLEPELSKHPAEAGYLY